MNRLMERTLGAICFVAGVGLVAPACGPENNGESQCSDGQVFATVNGTDGCYDECDNGACSGGASCQSGLCVGGGDNNGTNNANAGTNNGSSNANANAGTNNDTTNAGTNNDTANAGTNNDTTAACPEALDPPIGPCDPLCQSGCVGDQACAAGASGAGAPLQSRCVPSGDLGGGETCDPMAPACQAGYGCLTDPDSMESTCQEYCDPGGATTCSNADANCAPMDMAMTLGVCVVPEDACDMLDDQCPADQKCAPTSVGNQCVDTAGKAVGAACSPGECDKTLLCVGPDAQNSTCRLLCDPDAAPADNACATDAGQACQTLNNLDGVGVCI